MLLSLAIFAFLVAALAVSGISVNTLLKRKNTLNNFIWAQMIGMAALLSSMAFGLNFGFATAQIVFIQLAIFSLLTVFLIIRTLKSKVSHKGFELKRLADSRMFLAFPAVVFAYLSQGDFFRSAYAFRVGSDMFGWSISATTLRRAGSLQAITDRVQAQLGTTSLIDSFRGDLPANLNSIQQLNSFNDLITVSFVTGAHRTGGPGLLAGICGIIGENQISSAYTALMAWAIFMISIISYQVAKNFKASKGLALVIALAIPLSASTLSVSLEGGFGQLLTLPYLLFAAATLVKKRARFIDFSAAILLMVVAAFATYFDLLYIALPLILGLFAIKLALRNVQFERANFKNLAFQLGLFLIATFYFLPESLRLVLAVFANPTYGGWDQGRIPLPIDIFGIVPWLPTGDRQVTIRSEFDWYFEIALSIILILFIVFTPKSISRGVTALLVVAYVYLFCSVYAAEPFNNYRLWKFAAYASTLLVFAYANAFAKGLPNLTESKLRLKLATLKSALIRWAGMALILLSLVTSAVWSADWVITRKVQMPDQDRAKFNSVAEKYDVLFDGSYGGNLPLEVAMFADLHYMYVSRYPNKPTWRSEPARDLVIITPLEMQCSVGKAESKMMQKVASVETIGTNNLFKLCKVNLE